MKLVVAAYSQPNSIEPGFNCAGKQFIIYLKFRPGAILTICIRHSEQSEESVILFHRMLSLNVFKLTHYIISFSMSGRMS